MVIPLHSAHELSHSGTVLRKYLCENHRPLSIQLDALRISQLAPYHHNACEVIVNELKLWRKVLGPRRLASLELHYQKDMLEPYQITELIHCIASEFEIKNPAYRVVLRSECANAGILALLKGLGFMQCQFLIEHAKFISADDLASSFKLARKFQFDAIGVQITHSEDMIKVSQSIKALNNQLHPDYISIGQSTAKLTADDCKQGLTLFEDDLIDRDTDFLCLGPEAVSELGDLKLDSISDPARYVDEIQQRHLPVNLPPQLTDDTKQ